MERLYNQPGVDLPRFVYLHLPNDHMAKPRPVDGYPFARLPTSPTTTTRWAASWSI